MPLDVSRFLPFAKLKRLLPSPTLGVRGLVIDAQGKVLLVRHTYVAGWYLPGGGVEKSETAEASLARELAEEANVEIVGRPYLHGLFFNPKTSPRDHVACYVIREFRQSAPHVPDFEIAEAKFFAIDALPVETTRATRDRIDEVLSGRAPAQTW